MDTETVRRLTAGLRQGTDPRWVSLRAYLALEEIDPNRAVVADLFPDGTDVDTGILIDSHHRVFEFSLRYGASDEQRKQWNLQKLETSEEKWVSPDQMVRALSLRDRMEADVVSWNELYDSDAQFPHLQQIAAGNAVLLEEGI
jgi:hypothetical protein